MPRKESLAESLQLQDMAVPSERLRLKRIESEHLLGPCLEFPNLGAQISSVGAHAITIASSSLVS